MADDDHGVRIVREMVLEPERAFEVEIVGRLVEQQQVGLREQTAASATRMRQPPENSEQGRC